MAAQQVQVRHEVGSMFGIIALAGVVVNDSLTLIHTANRERWAGKSHFDSIFEASLQASSLNPMAISLGFGILIALILIPCLYLAPGDIRRLFRLTSATRWL